MKKKTIIFIGILLFVKSSFAQSFSEKGTLFMGGGISYSEGYKIAPVVSFGIQLKLVYLDMAASVTGSAHEDTYGKGYLTDETQSFQFNTGPVFSIFKKKLDIAPIIGLSYFANPYSDQYYGKTVYENKKYLFNYGCALLLDFGKFVSFGIQTTNHGINLNMVLIVNNLNI
jgi:hypothetical protein